MTTHSRRKRPSGGSRGSYSSALPEGQGWLDFAGIMLGLAGTLNVIHGIVALANSRFSSHDAVFVFSDLRTWGWIVLVLGIVELFAAAAVVQRRQWARWFGVSAAGLNAIGQMLFIQSTPFWSICVIAVDVLVIYALCVHGGRQPAGASS